MIQFCFLLLFCPVDLFIADSGVLKSSIIPVCFSLKICQYLLKTFQCSDIGSIYTYGCYIFLIYWPLYHYIMVFVSHYDFWLEVYFVWYKNGYIHFLLVTTCLAYHLPPLQFELMFVFGVEMSLMKAAYSLGLVF